MLFGTNFHRFKIFKIFQYFFIFRVIFALIFAATGIGQASSMLGDFAKAQEATRSLLNLFSLAPKIDNLSNDGYQVWDAQSDGKNNSKSVHVAFKDVHFRYPSRPKVRILKGFNLDIVKGKTVAFVGPSGCGKSTLMQLIQRFYDPEQGEVVCQRLGFSKFLDSLEVFQLCLAS